MKTSFLPYSSFAGLVIVTLSVAFCLVECAKTPEQQLKEFHIQELRRVRVERSIDSLDFAIRMDVARRSPQLFESQNNKR